LPCFHLPQESAIHKKGGTWPPLNIKTQFTIE